jgi:hypothetical protein
MREALGLARHPVSSTSRACITSSVMYHEAYSGQGCCQLRRYRPMSLVMLEKMRIFIPVAQKFPRIARLEWPQDKPSSRDR